MRILRSALFLLVALLCMSYAKWGFYGHRLITSLAIHTLPSDLIWFYKEKSNLLVEKSVAPDRRRYVIEAEGPRHYIDLDNYDDIDSIPKYWHAAIDRYGERFLNDQGLGPWYTYYTYIKLIEAFKDRDERQIVLLSSDLSHYIADANVPLHTTSNYNGQKTGQTGIHGFWETRLPQIFSDEYDFFVGRAEYIDDPQAKIWHAVFTANDLVDSIFIVERRATEAVGEDRKFSFEDRGKKSVRVYSEKFALEFHSLLPTVEPQMRRSIKMVGDLWFTAWVEAGQPDLNDMVIPGIKSDSIEIDPTITPKRPHSF